ncbi:hypothetical protein AGABI2DRAFT_210331 [Agaricus bisporus var. bisporus H97]|uniref:hypothetical protein n=1 Tax=Agaricus bisporus var. bisporus (strain H97 / ATCC MYA-4626 / FGSC 10389) TaxID=936046 RepID=UPI00029F74BD|nr:hypothetical protein AGABI2DRAFT_210331 [Agaricus bisporus var. bisporus H97]EKV43547.1 hypothetical protein AGABI2DRAFT_210331 [Agaricus bisporus var. bisporus H97]
MATRKVVYDDQDPIIQYSGEWFEKFGALEGLGNFGSPYLYTLHGTNHDASVSFEFDGTGIEVYGTSNLSNPKSDPDPNLECFIDGVSIGRDSPFEFPENNWKLCGKGGFSVGLHSLRIDIKVKSPKQTFWLDSIRYEPSPSVPLDNKTIRMENSDSAILLDDNWGSFGPFKGTTKANAVAVIDFIGTSVSWVGYIPSEFPHGSAFGTYSFDDGEPIEFKLAGLPGNQDTSGYSQVFFTTLEVENGPHTLTTTFLGSGDTTPLTLDCLYIKNGTIAPASSRSSTTMNNPSTASTPNIATNSGSVNGGGEARLNIGALLGGLLGGLGLFILIAGIFLYRWRRRLSQKNVLQPFYSDGGLPTIVDRNGRPNMMAQPTNGGVALPVDQFLAKRREALGVETRGSIPILADRLSTKQREASGVPHGSVALPSGRLSAKRREATRVETHGSVALPVGRLSTKPREVTRFEPQHG